MEIDFSTWREEFRRALQLGEATSVPCAGCTACCRSSQFVHIEPDEVETLAHIDPALLFPAPGRPAGHVVMGYDGDGCCPMLSAAGCRIYEHRPRTCRTYDCRVFAAAGVVADQPLVAGRAATWRFTNEEERREVVHRAAELQVHGTRAAEAAVRAVMEDPPSL